MHCRAPLRLLLALLIATAGACTSPAGDRDGSRGDAADSHSADSADIIPASTDAIDSAPDAALDTPVDDSTDASTDSSGIDAFDATSDDRGDGAGDTRDGGPACICPPLPSTCAPPAANSPAFSPATDALQRQLFAVLACATSSLHVAIYESDWACVVDAFIAQLDAVPALTLDLVIDDEQCPRVGGVLTCALSRLETHARVRIVDDMRTGNLMHDKFVIADGTRAWVASANMVRQSFCTDANNGIVIEEAPIVSAYEAEFTRMFAARQFGPIAPAPPVAGTLYTVYFSPRSPVTMPAVWFTDMITAIGAATTSLEFEIASWTRTEVSDALIAAAARGVRVRGVVSALSAGGPPAMQTIAAGIPLRIGLVHSKSIVIDGRTVITGSPNWSANAWSNNENSLWIRDATISAAYQTEFERVYAGSRAP